MRCECFSHDCDSPGSCYGACGCPSCSNGEGYHNEENLRLAGHVEDVDAPNADDEAEYAEWSEEQETHVREDGEGSRVPHKEDAERGY